MKIQYNEKSQQLCSITYINQDIQNNNIFINLLQQQSTVDNLTIFLFLESNKHCSGLRQKILTILKNHSAAESILNQVKAYFSDQGQFYQIQIYIPKNFQTIQNLNSKMNYKQRSIQSQISAVFDLKDQTKDNQDFCIQSRQVLNSLEKIISNGGNQKQKQILLKPNGNLIKGTFSHIGNIFIGTHQTIYFNQNESLYIKQIKDAAKILNNTYDSYIKGQLNPTNGINQATITINQQKILVSLNKIGINRINSSSLVLNNNYNYQQFQVCGDNDNAIQLQTFESIYEGRWINQKVIDFYLTISINYYKTIMLTSQNKYNNILINTCNTQDLLSTEPFQQKHVDYQFWAQLKEKLNIDTDSIQNRYIFVANINRSHFICLVLELNKYTKQYELQQLDSMNTQRSYQDIDIIFKNFESMFQYVSLKKQYIQYVKVTQQNNGYDCGCHSIHNALIVYKNPHLTIKQMEEQNLFEITSRRINKLRYHIQEILLNQEARIGDY